MRRLTMEPLSSGITVDDIRETSDEIDQEVEKFSIPNTLIDEIDDVMEEYFKLVVNRLAIKRRLPPEQVEELHERLCWRLDLANPE